MERIGDPAVWRDLVYLRQDDPLSELTPRFARLGLLAGDDDNRRVRAVLPYLEGVRGPVIGWGTPASG